MRFSPRKAINLVVLLAMVFLLAFPALAFAADTAGGARTPTRVQEPDKKAQQYLDTQSLAPGDPRPGMLKEMASKVPEEYLPQALKPEKDASSALSGGAMSGSGTGEWFPIARVYGTRKDASLMYDCQEPVTDSNGRTHFVYTISQQVGLPDPPDPDWNVTLTDLYYRSFNNGAWADPMNLTTRTGTESNRVLFFDADSDGYLHLLYTRWDYTHRASGGYFQSNGNIYYRSLAPGGDWSAPSKLSDYSGALFIQSSSFMQGANDVRGAYITLRETGTAPQSYDVSVNYLAGVLDEWQPPVLLQDWDFVFEPGGRIPFTSPDFDVSQAGEENFVSWNYIQLGSTPSLADSTIVVRERVTSGGVWQPSRTIITASGSILYTVGSGFRPYSNQAVCAYMSFAIADDEFHPPAGNIFFTYRQGTGWKTYNLSNCSPEEMAYPSFVNIDPAQRFGMLYGVERYHWNGSSWEMDADRLMYRAEAAPGVLTPAKKVYGYEAGSMLDVIQCSVDPDGGVHAFYSKVDSDYTNNRLCYSVMPAGKTDFEEPLILQGPTSRRFDWVVISSLPGDRVLASWMEYRFSGGIQNTGAIRSRIKEDGVWAPSVLVSEVPGNQIVPAVNGPYPYYYEIGQSMLTGEQQAVFEAADYSGGSYSNLKTYWAQTAGGVWSEPELVYTGSPAVLAPWLDMDLNGRSTVIFGTEDPNTEQNITLFTEQKMATPPSTTYFAEGTTRDGFDEYLTIQNANYTKASIDITYMLENGETPTQQFEIAPRARTTVDVSSVVGIGHDVSAVVTADQVVAVERPMYFDYQGWTGGSTALGVLSPMRTWYFAEGTTRDGYQEFLSVLNPSDRDVELTVSYVTSGGEVTDKQVGVPAHTRVTRDVNADVGPGKDVSMIVDSPDVAVVAERPMYFDYQGWTGGHDVTGSPSLAQRWYFAEGTTRHNDVDGQYDAYLSILNPTTADAQVTFRFLLGDGTVDEHSMMVPATSRQTLNVKDAIGLDKDFSTAIISDTAVLAERSMYFDYRDKWTGGTATVGAESPKNSWFLAEGTTRDGFDEWITLENAGPADGTASIDYMPAEGPVTTQDVTVPAHSRVTVDVALFLGRGKDVSAQIWCDQGIIVERPMYFDYNGAWTGGHSVVGL